MVVRGWASAGAAPSDAVRTATAVSRRQKVVVMRLPPVVRGSGLELRHFVTAIAVTKCCISRPDPSLELFLDLSPHFGLEPEILRVLHDLSMGPLPPAEPVIDLAQVEDALDPAGPPGHDDEVIG